MGAGKRALLLALRFCAIAGIAAGAVLFGYKSDAEARNNSNRYDEECWFEGCDNEELEEMWDNGDYSEETQEWSRDNQKTRFAASFEAAELAAPNHTNGTAWTYCWLMTDDFMNRLNKPAGSAAVATINSYCGTASANNWHRNH